MGKFYHLMISAFRLPLYKIRRNHVSFFSEIHKGVFMRGSTVGKYCYIGAYTSINNAVIGNYCSIAPQVQIGAMEHAINDLSTNTWLSDKGNDAEMTFIGHDVWIAAGCIIRQGAHIGNGAVIGANSFVNKDIPPYAVAVGSPAKVIRFRFPDNMIADLQMSEYYTLTPPRKSKCKLQEIRRKHRM